MLLLVLLPYALIFVTIVYFARRYMRAIERRNDSRLDADALTRRIAVLEDQSELQTAEIARLSEGLRFTEKLLASEHRQLPR